MVVKILNLGAGVQSSAILLKCIHGELPVPDHAIFADTGDEPKAVYDWLQVLIRLAKDAGIPVHVVSREGETLLEHMTEQIKTGKRLDKIPAFVANEKGKSGPIMRDCTGTFKIKVIDKKVKEILGIAHLGRWPKELAVETWIGISADEMNRMKCSTNVWQRFWHPLIEQPWRDNEKSPRFLDKPIRREDCMAWLEKHGYMDVPRSACIYCPFHSNREWRRVRSVPDEWERACQVDELLRSGPNGLIHAMRQPIYLHPSLVPLREANIDGAAGQLSLWDDECAGVCGV